MSIFEYILNHWRSYYSKDFTIFQYNRFTTTNLVLSRYRKNLNIFVLSRYRKDLNIEYDFEIKRKQ